MSNVPKLPEKGAFQKKMNHLTTIDFQGIFVRFLGSFSSNPIQVQSSDVGRAAWGFIPPYPNISISKRYFFLILLLINDISTISAWLNITDLRKWWLMMIEYYIWYSNATKICGSCSHINSPPVQMGKRPTCLKCQPPVLIPIIVYVQYAEITDFTYVTLAVKDKKQQIYSTSRCHIIGGVHFYKNVILLYIIVVFAYIWTSKFAMNLSGVLFQPCWVPWDLVGPNLEQMP